MTDPKFNASAYDPVCQNFTQLNTTYVANYPNKIAIFELIELFSICFAMCILGIIKNLIYVEGIFYEPEDFRHGKIRTVLMRNLGP